MVVLLSSILYLPFSPKSFLYSSHTPLIHEPKRLEYFIAEVPMKGGLDSEQLNYFGLVRSTHQSSNLRDVFW